MKKIIILLALSVLICSAHAETPQNQVNYFFSQNGIGISLEINDVDASIRDNFLIAENGDRLLALDLSSFKEKQIKEFVPDRIVISAGPKITFLKNSKELISVMQISEGKTKIFFGIAADPAESAPSVYIVEHYFPELPSSDKRRTLGDLRLAAIAKNNPEVEILNTDFSASLYPLMIRTGSFFRGSKDRYQLDILGSDKIKEIIGFEDFLLLQISLFSYNNLFDRGYTADQIRTNVEKIKGDDVTPELCSKLGFVFLPGYGYDSFAAEEEFTKHSGWAMGLAHSENNDFSTSLDDMELFIKKAVLANLTPVIQIRGKEFDVPSVSEFIVLLNEKTNNSLKYVQLWDKLDEAMITDYAKFAADVKENIGPVELISASGADLSYSFDSDVFSYTGIYNISACNAECMKSDKEFFVVQEAVLTEDNFWQVHSMLQSFKENKKIKAAFIHSANSWKDYPENAWMNSDGTLKLLPKTLSSEICQ